MPQLTAHPTLTEEVAAFLARGPSAEEIAAYRISEHAQERVRMLLEKNEDGTLSPEDSAELDEVTVLDQLFTLIRARHASPAPSSASSSSDDLPAAPGNA